MADSRPGSSCSHEDCASSGTAPPASAAAAAAAAAAAPEQPASRPRRKRKAAAAANTAAACAAEDAATVLERCKALSAELDDIPVPDVPVGPFNISVERVKQLLITLTSGQRTPVRRRGTGSDRNGRAGHGKPSSVFRGVNFHSRTGRWEAHVCHTNQQVHLGCFDLEVHAALAYDLLSLKARGDTATLNFPADSYQAESRRLSEISMEDLIHRVRGSRKLLLARIKALQLQAAAFPRRTPTPTPSDPTPLLPPPGLPPLKTTTTNNPTTAPPHPQRHARSPPRSAPLLPAGYASISQCSPPLPSHPHPAPSAAPAATPAAPRDDPPSLSSSHSVSATTATPLHCSGSPSISLPHPPSLRPLTLHRPRSSAPDPTTSATHRHHAPPSPFSHPSWDLPPSTTPRFHSLPPHGPTPADQPPSLPLPHPSSPSHGTSPSPFPHASSPRTYHPESCPCCPPAPPSHPPSQPYPYPQLHHRHPHPTTQDPTHRPTRSSTPHGATSTPRSAYPQSTGCPCPYCTQDRPPAAVPPRHTTRACGNPHCYTCPPANPTEPHYPTPTHPNSHQSSAATYYPSYPNPRQDPTPPPHPHHPTPTHHTRTPRELPYSSPHPAYAPPASCQPSYPTFDHPPATTPYPPPSNHHHHNHHHNHNHHPSCPCHNYPSHPTAPSANPPPHPTSCDTAAAPPIQPPRRPSPNPHHGPQPKRGRPNSTYPTLPPTHLAPNPHLSATLHPNPHPAQLPPSHPQLSSTPRAAPAAPPHPSWPVPALQLPSSWTQLLSEEASGATAPAEPRTAPFHRTTATTSPTPNPLPYATAPWAPATAAPRADPPLPPQAPDSQAAAPTGPWPPTNDPYATTSDPSFDCGAGPQQGSHTALPTHVQRVTGAWGAAWGHQPQAPTPQAHGGQQAAPASVPLSAMDVDFSAPQYMARGVEGQGGVFNTSQPQSQPAARGAAAGGWQQAGMLPDSGAAMPPAAAPAAAAEGGLNPLMEGALLEGTLLEGAWLDPRGAMEEWVAAAGALRGPGADSPPGWGSSVLWD